MRTIESAQQIAKIAQEAQGRREQTRQANIEAAILVTEERIFLQAEKGNWSLIIDNIRDRQHSEFINHFKQKGFEFDAGTKIIRWRTAKEIILDNVKTPKQIEADFESVCNMIAQNKGYKDWRELQGMATAQELENADIEARIMFKQMNP